MNVQKTPSCSQSFGMTKVPSKVIREYLKPSLIGGYDVNIAAKSSPNSWKYIIGLLKDGKKTGTAISFQQKRGTDEMHMLSNMAQKINARVVTDSGARNLFNAMA